MQELHEICESLNRTKLAIEDGVEKLEIGKKIRDIKRKEILLSEMKQVLGVMAETDHRIVRDLKGEAFDKMTSLSKIADDIASLKAMLANKCQYDAYLEFVTIKNKFKSLGLDEFLKSLDISISIQPVILSSAFEEISDAIYLNSPELKSKQLLYYVDNFNFLNGSLKVEDIFKSRKLAVNSRSGTIKCLESPSCMTYLPEKQTFLVTEPSYNRVGLYEVASFEFVCWMGYPEQVGNGRTCYNYPTSVLALENGYVVLLEKDFLHIFDSQFCHFQSIEGEFHGLTEGPTGEILTISTDRLQDIVLKKLVREGSEAMLISENRSPYFLSGQIKLDVIQTFNKWRILSKPQFLTYSQGKVFITDLGLHKLYTVNLTTGEQSESGYMGSKFGNFKQPRGLVADDEGNLIVGDSENNRLVVVNKKGQLVKVVPQNEVLVSS